MNKNKDVAEGLFIWARLPGWPGKRDGFWLVFIWEIFIPVTEMKERPAAHKNTAEWLSAAVENTAGQAQCCNPVLFIAKAIPSLPKFEAKEADAFKPK